MRVLLYAKMLKETENEETKLFRQIFVIDGSSVRRILKRGGAENLENFRRSD